MSSNQLDKWIIRLREIVFEFDNSLIETFEIYAAEAKFGRLHIDQNLKKLSKDSSILEIGAGAMILSCFLVSEGFVVTALEPTGDGFSHLTKLRNLVLEFSKKNHFLPKIIQAQAEDFAEKELYDFAFSINVMEHVDDVESVILNIGNSLKTGGEYRFICPNYLFPYEPHFNIPIFINKRLTSKIFGSYIFRNEKIPDPEGLWKSLNWITAYQISTIVSKLGKYTLYFNKKILEDSFLRVIDDVEFSSRRPNWMKFLTKIIVYFGFHKIFSYFPVNVHPIIDCSIRKRP